MIEQTVGSIIRTYICFWVLLGAKRIKDAVVENTGGADAECDKTARNYTAVTARLVVLIP